MSVFINDLMRTADGHRRMFLQKLNKNYTKDKLKKRIGKCKRCGKCCESCGHLDKKTNLCKIYKRRPTWICYKEFLLDSWDQILWGVKKSCGYKFKK